MKAHIVYFIIFLFILVATTGCEKSELLQKEPQKIILRKKAAEVIKVNQTFAFELFREVYNITEDENLMISPLSVSYALGMTYNGASGTTLDAFNNVLHFGELTSMEVNESYKDLMDQLIHLDKDVKFSIANSIWYRLGFQVLQEFVLTNQTYFDAAVREMDFSDPGAVDIINKWIEDKTNGKIKDMLDYIPADAVMYLINAIYFNATWKYEFDKEETKTGLFYKEDATTIQAEFMKVNGGFNYWNNPDFTAVELPYGDSTFSMVVILPATGKKINNLVSLMNANNWSNWMDEAEFLNIQTELPKFKYGFKDLLNDPLKNLGLSVAFDPIEADFSRIRQGGGLFIYRVIHQTFIDVKEEGTEAAAATIVEMRETSAGPNQPVIFRADKPFLYIIKENSTGAILFIGTTANPEYL